MAEALEDLQDSTSRLEAENRTLKMGASPKATIGNRTGREGPAAVDVLGKGAPATGQWSGSETGMSPSQCAQAGRVEGFHRIAEIVVFGS